MTIMSLKRTNLCLPLLYDKFFNGNFQNGNFLNLETFYNESNIFKKTCTINVISIFNTFFNRLRQTY